MKQEDWQPIETAPKDGTRILGWPVEDWDDRDAGRLVHIIWWPSYGKWVFNATHEPTSDGCEPTHWMPLPGPPA